MMSLSNFSIFKSDLYASYLSLVSKLPRQRRHFPYLVILDDPALFMLLTLFSYSPLQYFDFWPDEGYHRNTSCALTLISTFTSRNWLAMQGPVAIILISWNVIFIWETGYWTRAIKRFALFDLLKSLYSDTRILSKYIPSLQKRL